MPREVSQPLLERFQRRVNLAFFVRMSPKRRSGPSAEFIQCHRSYFPFGFGGDEGFAPFLRSAGLTIFRMRALSSRSSGWEGFFIWGLLFEQLTISCAYRFSNFWCLKADCFCQKTILMNVILTNRTYFINCYIVNLD